MSATAQARAELAGEHDGKGATREADASTLSKAVSEGVPVGIRFDERKKTATTVPFGELRVGDLMIPYEDVVSGVVPEDWKRLEAFLPLGRRRRRRRLATLFALLGGLNAVLTFCGITLGELSDPVRFALIFGGQAQLVAFAVPILSYTSPPTYREISGLLRVPRAAAEGIAEGVLSHEEATRMGELAREGGELSREIREAQADIADLHNASSWRAKNLQRVIDKNRREREELKKRVESILTAARERKLSEEGR